MLSDGKDPDFDDWYTKIRGKLRINAEQFPSEQDKIDYVYSRTKGDAMKHLSTHMYKGSTMLFTKVQEVFDLLKSIYHDPNHTQKAHQDY